MYWKMQKKEWILLAIILMIVAMGVVTGWLYSRLPTNNPQNSQQGCESVGGDWDIAANKCLLSYKKVGEICVDSAQCVSGICSPPSLTEKQQSVLLHEPLVGIAGTCAVNSELIGCVPQVLKGSVSMDLMCWR